MLAYRLGDVKRLKFGQEELGEVEQARKEFCDREKGGKSLRGIIR